MINNHGVEYATQSEKVREKVKKTNMEKYGFECSSKNEKVKNKNKETCIKIYNSNSPLQNKEVQRKIKITLMEKYGVEHPIQNELIKSKTKQTMKNNYGVEYAMQNKFIKEKSKKSRISIWNQISDENLTAWKLYKKHVAMITYKNKKTLFKNWDGIDYYDKEYIKDNITIGLIKKFHPTIDHKISLLHGFNNNISPEDIGHINNLCITKMFINSSKNSKIESVFIKKTIPLSAT